MNAAETGIVLQLSDPTYRDRGSTEIHGISGKAYTFSYSDWFGFQVMYVKDPAEHEAVQKDIFGEEFQRESMYKYGMVTRYLTKEQNAQMAEVEEHKQMKRQAAVDAANAEVEAALPVALSQWEENLGKAKDKLEYAEKRKASGEVNEHDPEATKELDTHIATLKGQVAISEGHVKRIKEHISEVDARKKKEKPTVTIPAPAELARAKAEHEAKQKPPEPEPEPAIADESEKSPGGRSRR